MSQTLKTLSFQGQPIYYLADATSTNWVLIRSICEALGLHADWQVEAIKEDEILEPEHGVHRVQVPGDSQARNWFCLSEEYIYGWLFNIKLSNTMSEQTKANLTAYKRACYDLLYQHFHGRLKQVLVLDQEAALVSVELQAVEKRLAHKLQTDPDYQRKLDLEARQQQLRRSQRQGRQQTRQLAIEYALGVQEPMGRRLSNRCKKAPLVGGAFTYRPLCSIKNIMLEPVRFKPYLATSSSTF